MSCKIILFFVILIPNFVIAQESPEELFKRSGCTKCHHILSDKKKEGPSIFAISRKRKNDRSKIYNHLNNPPILEIDGIDDIHPELKTKDKKKIDEVVNWILSK